MYTFITNPNARSGLGSKVWNEIETILTEQAVEYQVFFTKYQRHATQLVKDLTSDGKPHTIIVLGGDGTINEVVNGICFLSKTTLGYIPIGSSNDFARGLHLPTDPKAALLNILSPSRYTSLDIGVLSYGKEERTHEKTRRFAVSSGIGFDAGVCHQVMVSPVKRLLNKFHLGKLSYAVIALHRMISLSPKRMTLILDERREITLDSVYFAAAMNLCYEGGGFKFCPEASCHDGILDLSVISGISKLKALALLPAAFKGWHVRFRGVRTYTFHTAEILSEVPLPVHADGEPVFLKRRVRFSLEDEALKVIT